MASTLTSQYVPNLAKTTKTKAYLTQYKKLIPLVTPESHPYRILKDLSAISLEPHVEKMFNQYIKNPNSLFFNNINYDKAYLPDQKIEVITSFEDDTPITHSEEATDLLAWNNDEELIVMRTYSFQHRNSEKGLSFDIDDIISGNRDLFCNPGLLENTYEELYASCVDKKKKPSLVVASFDLNPNVTDASGNTPLFCAVASDNLPAITALVNFGADLDKFNDECVTPLIISILKYLAVKENVSDWEVAFIPPSFSNLTAEELYVLNLGCKRVYFEAAKKKQKEKKGKQKEGGAEKKKGKGKSKEPEELVKSSAAEKELLEAQLKQQELEEKLLETYKTITTLLTYGASPNIGEVPLPPFVLSLFTKNEHVVEDFLTYGANCNTTTTAQDGSLTPLHVIAAMKPGEKLADIARILLKNGACLNRRNDVNHWPEEKLDIDPEKRFESEGKTPLHILAMRYDFIEDVPDYMGLLYDVLVEYGCNPDLNYLGHTCLSLAVLRGNLTLIDHILRTYEINPNQTLGYDMGVPLTILILKKYKNRLPLYICEEVFDLLAKYGANPFNTIGDSAFNCIDFCVHENAEGEGKKAKKMKKDAHFKVIQCLCKIARNTLEAHIMAKALKYIYECKMVSDIVHPIFDTMGTFLTLEQAMRILQIFINYGFTHIVPQAMVSLLEYIQKKTAPKKKKKPSKKNKKSIVEEINLEETVYDMILNKEPKTLRKNNTIEPEIDPAEEKYEVCFNCLEKFNKILVLCPHCEMVYFCSDRCNKQSNKKKTIHKCKGVFYSKQLKRIEHENIQPGILKSLDHKKLNFLKDVDFDFNVKYLFTNYPDEKDNTTRTKSSRFKDENEENETWKTPNEEIEKKAKKHKRKTDKAHEESKKDKSDAYLIDKKDKADERARYSFSRIDEKIRGVDKYVKDLKEAKRHIKTEENGKELLVKFQNRKFKKRVSSKLIQGELEGNKTSKSIVASRKSPKWKSKKKKSNMASFSERVIEETNLEEEAYTSGYVGPCAYITSLKKELKMQNFNGESLGNKIAFTPKLSDSLEYVMELHKKKPPSCILSNGQLYYKFPKLCAYCDINFSYV